MLLALVIVVEDPDVVVTLVDPDPDAPITEVTFLEYLRL